MHLEIEVRLGFWQAIAHTESDQIVEVARIAQQLAPRADRPQYWE